MDPNNFKRAESLNAKIKHLKEMIDRIEKTTENDEFHFKVETKFISRRNDYNLYTLLASAYCMKDEEIKEIESQIEHYVLFVVLPKMKKRLEECIEEMKTL